MHIEVQEEFVEVSSGVDKVRITKEGDIKMVRGDATIRIENIKAAQTWRT